MEVGGSNRSTATKKGCMTGVNILPDLFQVIDMGVNAGGRPNDWYGVFIVSPTKTADRYLLTSPFDKKAYADKFCAEFKRLFIEHIIEDFKVVEQKKGG